MKKKPLFKRIMTNLDAVICGVTLTICVILVNANVIFRYFLNNPIKWTDEVVTSLFIWTVFMGSAYAHRKHAHLGVDIVVNLIHGKARSIIEFVMDILQILILILLTYISAQYVCALIWKRGIVFEWVEGALKYVGQIKYTYTDTLRIPKWYTGIAVPLGFGLSLIYAIYFFLRDRLHLIKAKPQEESEKIVEEGGAY
ncbi:MAG: TRAP transporter small permease [Oscillospiraceae bacterium]|nr:TRAP transporter small permease [Oscillospiraceae bacterium]